eukprot:CAMPEP_0196596352 /NCGR_PEP_ID=MMETSP1081-20130531/85594_1 /TAXON_ID=36882 /ORGANISM="Pyramimonas amylifera, Strain CCMP720" /LENGTH=45 /DNA_ID= /DNA_START= /DNA_END= /DNA_ORIENTATION=
MTSEPSQTPSMAPAAKLKGVVDMKRGVLKAISPSNARAPINGGIS